MQKGAQLGLARKSRRWGCWRRFPIRPAHDVADQFDGGFVLGSFTRVKASIPLMKRDCVGLVVRPKSKFGIYIGMASRIAGTSLEHTLLCAGFLRRSLFLEPNFQVRPKLSGKVGLFSRRFFQFHGLNGFTGRTTNSTVQRFRYFTYFTSPSQTPWNQNVRHKCTAFAVLAELRTPARSPPLKSTLYLATELAPYQTAAHLCSSFFILSVYAVVSGKNIRIPRRPGNLRHFTRFRYRLFVRNNCNDTEN